MNDVAKQVNRIPPLPPFLLRVWDMEPHLHVHLTNVVEDADVDGRFPQNDEEE